MPLSKILRNTGLLVVFLSFILFLVPAININYLSEVGGLDLFEIIRILMYIGIGMIIISILIRYPLEIYIKRKGEHANAKILKVKESILKIGSYGRKTLLTLKIEVFPDHKPSFITEVERAIPLWGVMPQEGRNISVKCLPKLKRAVLVEVI